jgi:uncharacterized protein with PIN domain
MTRCEACGKPIVKINYDKARGVVGLTTAWVHSNRWVRHKPIAPEHLKERK